MTKYLGFARHYLYLYGLWGINPKYLVIATSGGISKRYLLEKKYHTCFAYKAPLGVKQGHVLPRKIQRDLWWAWILNFYPRDKLSISRITIWAWRSLSCRSFSEDGRLCKRGYFPKVSQFHSFVTPKFVLYFAFFVDISKYIVNIVGIKLKLIHSKRSSNAHVDFRYG